MISVVLATHNEEKNLARALDSIKQFANEIVIVDGNSTDNTVKIAQSYQAVVLQTTNKPIFHINKQLAIDQAKNNLILQLDADEAVDQELAKFIIDLDRNLMAKPSAVIDSAWWIRRKNNFLGHWLKKGGQYPDPVIRLFIKNKAFLPQKSVHEQMTVKGSIGWATGHLCHYSNPTLADYWRKLQAYTALEADKFSQTKLTVPLALYYLFIKPIITFLTLFFRHKGFIDGIYGFLFAFLSALHFPIIIYKVIKQKFS